MPMWTVLITGPTNRYIKPTGGQITALSPYGIRTVPLIAYTYIEPARVNDMVKSFLAFYEQNGRLPVWNFMAAKRI